MESRDDEAYVTLIVRLYECIRCTDRSYDEKTVDYQKLRGFNYTQPDAVNDRDFWANYHHDIVDRDMGYAERLHLNSARIFLSYDFTRKIPTGSLPT